MEAMTAKRRYPWPWVGWSLAGAAAVPVVLLLGQSPWFVPFNLGFLGAIIGYFYGRLSAKHHQTDSYTPLFVGVFLGALLGSIHPIGFLVFLFGGAHIVNLVFGWKVFDEPLIEWRYWYFFGFMGWLVGFTYVLFEYVRIVTISSDAEAVLGPYAIVASGVGIIFSIIALIPIIGVVLLIIFGALTFLPSSSLLTSSASIPIFLIPLFAFAAYGIITAATMGKIRLEEQRLKEEERRRIEEERIRVENERQEVDSLIFDVEGLIRNAIPKARDPASGALVILLEKVRNLSEAFKSGGIENLEAKVSILDLQEQRKAVMTWHYDDDSELWYHVLGVNRDADAYEILGISHNANKEKVDAVWKKERARWHEATLVGTTEKRQILAAEISKKMNLARDKIYQQRGW